jgi:hypothetical protein
VTIDLDLQVVYTFCMNLIVEIFHLLEWRTIFLIMVVILFIALEYIFRLSKYKINEDYETKRNRVDRFGDIEKEMIVYYRRNQTIDVIRVISAIVGIALLLLIFNIQALNILAIATGALIIILREQILSFIAYFYAISVFDIGDDLKVGAILGEVVRFKPFYVALAGKDETGQYTGVLHYVPNFKLMSEYIEESEIKTTTTRRIDIVAVYNHTAFPEPFPVWKEKVKTFLDQTLPVQRLGGVGNFKSFVGARYQIRFNYNDKGEVTAKISFVAKPPKTSEYKEEIISYIESLRKID